MHRLRHLLIAVLAISLLPAAGAQATTSGGFDELTHGAFAAAGERALIPWSASSASERGAPIARSAGVRSAGPGDTSPDGAQLVLPGAAGTQLARCASQLALGERTEDVLVALARRTGLPSYDTLVAAVLLQRDAGGDLAGLLRSVARSLEESARVAADARSATAQARFTAGVVTGLPVAAAALAELAQPGYLLSLVRSPIPGALAGVAAVLQIAALLLVRRLARVRA